MPAASTVRTFLVRPILTGLLVLILAGLLWGDHGGRFASCRVTTAAPANAAPHLKPC